jgi:hypothetical protein
MNEETTAVITRVKEVLSEVSMGISQARVALSEAKDELSDIFDRLERAEAVNGHNRQVTEDKVLSQMRQKEHDSHPGG